MPVLFPNQQFFKALKRTQSSDADQVTSPTGPHPFMIEQITSDGMPKQCQYIFTTQVVVLSREVTKCTDQSGCRLNRALLG